ncbi:MAG: hypothetical protein IPK19_15960 [Chloroflexi bacterium]|nr:hypothetical protein [Chloroflexota bacterium]
MSLLVRFHRALPLRPVRRLLALLCLTLCVSLFATAPASAACPASFPVTVPAGDTARLIEVIGCANSNGAGTNDVINLTNSTYTLTAIHSSDTGLPPIGASNGTLTINGNGATIARSSAGGTPDFRLFFIGSGANLTLNQVTLSNGRMTGGSGGAINNAGTLRVVGSTIANNTANGGGGIINFSGGTVTLRESLLANNVATSYGGGIANSGGTVNVVNTTISGNAANGTSSSSGGGAVDIYGGSLAYVLFINSTIAYNTAVAPNGVRSGIWQESGKSSYFNTIVANNNGTNNCLFTGGIWENNLNSLDNGVSCGFDGTWAANTDPMLAPLANNGGPTQTHALLPGSPAINHADDAYITEEDRITTLTIDQRGAGFPRNVGGLPDIGAYEVQCPAAFPATVPAGDSMRLIELIGCANANGAGTNDVINLAPASTYTLSLALFGSNGLPPIVSASSNGTLTINGNGATITRSSAGGTPEFRLFNLNAGANLTLNQLWLTNGLLSGGSGGAIYNSGGTLALTSSTIAVNNANFGAGLYNSNGSTAIIRDSLLANNVAVSYGGAIVNSSATLHVVNSTISGNAANGTGSTGGGGAIDSFGASAAVNFYNSTIAYNTAVAPNTAKSGLWREAGTSFFVNSIIANNNGANNCFRSGGSGETIPNSNIENGNTCGLGGLQADPILAPLANNGGLTQTHALLPGSPAINSGDTSWAVEEDEATVLTTDQRGAGYPRIVGGTVDIGAYESVCGTSNFDIGAGDTVRLIEAINCANASATPDVINLTNSTYTLTTTGLPTITSGAGALTINGNGATIARSSAGGTPNFRILLVNSGATLTLNNVTLTNGSAPGGNGGAINNSGTLTVINSIFRANAAISGGGIFQNSGTLRVINSIFVGNSAMVGGSIVVNGGTVTVTNSTFSANTATSFGAGLAVIGAVSVTVNNSILANSVGSGCNSNVAITFQNSLNEDGTCGITNGVNGNKTGDPALVNDSTDLTLQSSSIALNAGSNALAVDQNGSPLVYDQRGAGFPRINGGAVDIGAYELQCPTFPHTVAAGDTADLIFSITCANASASADVINLTAGSTYTLTSVYGSETGLPGISAAGGALTINGNGAMITRSGAGGVPDFRFFYVYTGANLTLNTMTLTNGSVPGATGGAIYNEGTLSVNGVLLSGNTALGGGGIENAGSLTILNSTIASNSASLSGGGVQIDAPATIINSTLSGNSSPNGGAINSNASLTIINSTISDNDSADGAGLRAYSGTYTVHNSIIANSLSGADCVNYGNTFNALYSLIEDGLSCVTGDNFGNLTGDAALAALANNGGLTPTHSLVPGSPGINAGGNGLAVDQNSAALTTDQRGAGYPRVIAGTVDIGAYESVCPSFPAAIATSDSTGLINAITCANATAANDVINLNAGSTYTLTEIVANLTGLPPIVTAGTAGTLTINGNGATITRSSAGGTPQFRLFHVNENANLTLNRLTLTNGLIGQEARDH